MSLPVTRVTDMDLVHCSLPRRMMGAKKVIVNGRPWSRMGDINTPHKKHAGKKCVTHVAPIAIGSPRCIVQGRPAGHIFLPILACTITLQGSPNVLVG